MSQSTLNTADQAWSTTAPNYAANVGRTSAISASRLMDLGHGLSRITTESSILDVGAGTGAVTSAVASKFPSTKILATDISASMLGDIDALKFPNVSTKVLDARTLSKEFVQKSFSHVFNAFMLQTITNPMTALGEMRDVLVPGGVLAVGIWGQRNSPFEIWEQAVQLLDSTYQLPAPFDDPKAWRTEEELQGALKEMGFQHVRSEEIKVPFEFESAEAFEDFWFKAKNPASLQCINSFEGDMESVKEAMKKIVKENYADGKGICTWAVLGIGQKTS
ncbi:hypothetical protein ACLMJK_001602 [Lecanora helva]